MKRIKLEDAILCALVIIPVALLGMVGFHQAQAEHGLRRQVAAFHLPSAYKDTGDAAGFRPKSTFNDRNYLALEFVVAEPASEVAQYVAKLGQAAGFRLVPDPEPQQNAANEPQYDISLDFQRIDPSDHLHYDAGFIVSGADGAPTTVRVEVEQD
jgi:hypothetical protein